MTIYHETSHLCHGFNYKKEVAIVIFFLINLFIYFWLHWVLVAAHGLSRCSERGLLFIAAHGFLVAVASLATEHGL